MDRQREKERQRQTETDRNRASKRERQKEATVLELCWVKFKTQSIPLFLVLVLAKTHLCKWCKLHFHSRFEICIASSFRYIVLP